MASGVARAGTRIKRLVGNLAASARLDREGVELPTGPVRVDSLFEAALIEFSEDRERITIGSADGLAIWADLPLASRALIILLENALAFSGDVVGIEATSVGDNVDLLVHDRGPGLSGDVRARLFEPFTQADTSTTRTHQGIGIGLFLAKRIMVAHSGGIAAAPREGGGTTFRLSFPSSEVGAP